MNHTVKTILKWFFGISLLIGGIATISNSLIGGIFIAIAGAMLLPPVLAAFEKNIGKPLSRQVKYGVCIGLFILGSALSSKDKKVEASVDKKSETTMNKEDQTANSGVVKFDADGNRVTSKEEEKETKKSISYILKDTDEFKDNFNSFARESQSKLRIRDISVEDGDVNNTFQYMLNDRLAIIGSLNKEDNSVKSVMMMGQGDGTSMSGLNIIVAMGGIIAGVDPSLVPNERGQILRELNILGSDDISNLSGSTIKNGIKYSISSSDAIGIMFAAEKAE